jgi:hypothetical protein
VLRFGVEESGEAVGVESTAEVTAAEIARIAGVGRAAVSNWRKRYADFPKAVGGTHGSPAFRLADIEDWLRANNRLPQERPLAELWLAVQHASAGAGSIERTVLGIADLLAARPARAARRQSGARRDQLAEDELPVRLRHAVKAAVEAAGAPAVFDFLLERYLDLQPRRGFTPTPSLVADLMTDLVDVGGAVVLDPACGGGALLAAAASQGAAKLLGQDDEADLVTLTRLRLEIGGVAVDVREGSLRDDGFVDALADVVLLHPPFGQRDWGYDELTFDPRWEYELPARSEPELAWVQYALARLKPGGWAVVLLPPSVAGRSSGKRVRNALLRRGALRAVVALPPGAAPPAHLPLHLWVLRHPESPTTPSDLLLVDATGRSWPAAAAAIREAVTGYLTGGSVPAGHEETARAVPLIDLVDNDIDVTPARHLAAERPTVDPEQVLAGRAALAKLLKELPRLLPDVEPSAAPPPHRIVTVADLVKDGQVAVLNAQETQPRPGDVLIPTSGARPQAMVVAEANDPPTMTGPHVLLRPNLDQLDPWFLAGFVCRESNVRMISSLGSSRLDVRRAQLPHLPLARQQAYGAWFERLDVFDRAVREASTLSAEVTHLIAEGLAAGTLRSRA